MRCRDARLLCPSERVRIRCSKIERAERLIEQGLCPGTDPSQRSIIGGNETQTCGVQTVANTPIRLTHRHWNEITDQGAAVQVRAKFLKVRSTTIEVTRQSLRRAFPAGCRRARCGALFPRPCAS